MAGQADLKERLFHAALELADPAQRAAFLDAACAGDAGLRAKIDELMKHDAEGGSFMKQPALPRPTATTDGLPAERPGMVIGRYKLLELVGEGGMGAVWVAEQTEPVRRKVALKVIKAGMDSKSVLARFEAERQALALMDHPNIAKVLDGGITEPISDSRLQNADCKSELSNLKSAIPAGRPYFVMEYVKGVPITEYCDAARLSVAERLNLFAQVCQAVQHAHQKGIIHRDLKPSNILVAPYDDKPVPKVIDFGLAKAMHQSLTERTLHTAHETVLGTPLYMSPEQAQLNNLDVDTRSDIYSLGVLLYELLTGTTPLEKQRFKEAAWDEVRRLIREEEPPRPSTRLSSTHTLPSLAACRQTEPGSLTKLVRGELDWIVMKALEKDRTRRYETANGFAMDVQRYLTGEPVLAVPPSAGYRLRKFARRNKRGLTAAACAVIGLWIAVGAVGWAVRDRAARQQTALKEEAARQAKLEEEITRALDDVSSSYQQDKLAEAMAAVKRAEALQVNGGASKELQERVRRWRADLEMVNRLEAIRLERSDVKKGAYNWKGTDRVYREDFQRYGLDLEAAEAALVARSIRASAVRDRLVAALDDWLLIARSVNRTAGERLLAVVRHADPDPWRNRLREAFWGDNAQAIRSLAEEESASTQPPASVLLLAAALNREDDYHLAIEVLRKAQRRYPADFWINYSLGSKILSTINEGMFNDAVGFFRAAAALRPRCAAVYQALAFAFLWLERMEEAEAVVREWVRFDPDNANARNSLADVFLKRNQLDEAETEIRRALRLKPELGVAHVTLGEILEQRGKRVEAAAEFRAALCLELAPATWFSCTARLLLLEEHTSEYGPACERLLNRYAQDPRRWTLYFVARTCVLAPDSTPDPAQGVRLAELAVNAAPNWAHNLHTLGMAHYRTGQLDEAIRRFNDSIDANPRWSGQVVNWLGLALAHHRRGQIEGGRFWYNQAVAWIDRVAPKGNRESPTPPPGVHEHEWLACRLLRREAEALLNGVMPIEK